MARSQRSTAPHHQGKTPPATLAVSWLVNDQQGASVLAAARDLLAAQEAVREALPAALAHACQVARIDRQQMTLAVPGAAYAAKLRQVAPRIIQRLAQRGWNLQTIQVRVQAGLPWGQEGPARRDVVPLDDQALQAFDALRSNLRPGPLADAIGKLLAHHRR